MQPTLQISAAEEYSEEPRRSSGGLYHNVMACGDRRVFGVPYILARPKSASFIVPSFKKRQLSGFKSLLLYEASICDDGDDTSKDGKMDSK